MQNFLDSATGQIWALEDNVKVISAGGVLAFETAQGEPLINVPTTLQPYVVPAPTAAQLLANAQNAQIQALATSYAEAIQVPVSYTSKGGITKTYQADPQSVANLTQMLLTFQAAAATPAGFYWVSVDNTRVPFTYADMQGLASAFGAQGVPAFQKLQNLKAEVLGATTVSAVQAIVW